MGKKYIVEVGDNENLYKTTIQNGGKSYIAVVHGEPYTKPDLEQVRKEAYEKGYKKCLSEHDFDSPCVSCGEYKRGLDDAWEAARKIHRMPDGDFLDLFLDRYASVCTAAQAILKYDASEAIAKIKKYEDGKQEYRVGDEFENGAGKKFVVLKMDGKEIDRYIDGDGKTYVMDMKYRAMRKTGRHFPEVAAVLEKMRGE